ncbi:restriction endonuclease subunit S [Marinimicrobium alkaliphilum]|uniref:restriction endonuclease subunit S n=1 Tax=Marinimicrobium alkaliphilum TaxID=2202654 RepID=UPI0018E0BF76|nr:restriction endonuclease subunit S [Marinimicrobium alkaliphilum]
MFEASVGTSIKVLSGFAFPSTGFTAEDGIPLVRIRDIMSGKTEVNYIGPYPDDYLIESGDLLVGMDGDFNVVRWEGREALLNQRVCKISSNSPSIHQGFLFWYLIPQIEKIHRVTPQTTVKHLSTKRLYEIPLPGFSFSEQEYIANILDTLDTQIRRTEAIIAKLQQVKQGLLHDLLTRGIDANGQLRPPRDQAPELYSKFSQGFFPVEWKEVKLGSMADIVSGVTVGGSGGKSRSVSVPYLRVANVQDGYLDLSEVKSITVSAEEKERYRLQYGDVLMNEGGDFDKLGRGTVWEEQIEECIHQNHVFRVRVDKKQLSPFFLAYWSGSHYGKKYFVLSSKQSTNLASINSTQLKAYPVMVPPAAEQLEIETRVKSINSKMDSHHRENEKLKKQKSGLMDDLLTGRVRVTSLLDTAKAS